MRLANEIRLARLAAICSLSQSAPAGTPACKAISDAARTAGYDKFNPAATITQNMAYLSS
jgi:hypothetical protein